MSTFGALGISASGLAGEPQVDGRGLRQHREHEQRPRTVDAAFQARFVVAQPGNGAAGRGRARSPGSSSATRRDASSAQPDHPLADADGMVRVPDIDMGDQMVQLMMAQRAYQANLSVVDRAKDAYQAALQLGR